MIVIILGMHRAGTSMLSSMVHSLGIKMGDEDSLKRYDPDSQPNGYWEDREFQEINRAIIKDAGGHWHKPPGRLKIIATSIAYRDKIKALIDKRREEAKRWGWKDPRNCLTIECYQFAFEDSDDVRYVHIIRSPEAIAQSLIKRGEVLSRLPDQEAAFVKLANEHNRRVRDFFNRWQRTHYEVAYEDILKYPSYETGRLATYLGVTDEKLIDQAVKRIRA